MNKCKPWQKERKETKTFFREYNQERIGLSRKNYHVANFAYST